MDIRTKTGLIIRRGGQYLVGTVLYSTDLRWSIYTWDAWFTQNKEDAQRVAEKVGGEIFLFNPIAGQLRALGGANEGSH